MKSFNEIKNGVFTGKFSYIALLNEIEERDKLIEELKKESKVDWSVVNSLKAELAQLKGEDLNEKHPYKKIGACEKNSVFTENGYVYFKLPKCNTEWTDSVVDHCRKMVGIGVGAYVAHKTFGNECYMGYKKVIK